MTSDLRRESLTIRVCCPIVAYKMSKFDQSRAPLVDRVQMGRLFRAARTIAGFDRVEDAVKAINDKTGYNMTSRALYALERGEQAVTLEHMLAVTMTFSPPGNVVFFNGGYRADVQEMLASYGRSAYGQS